MILLRSSTSTNVGFRYCPPNLLEQGVVWIGLSLVGILFGTGF